MTVYATAAELRDRINKSKTDDDTILLALLTGASLSIDNFCHRPEGFVSLATAAARLFAGNGKAYLYLPEFTAVTVVEIKDSLTDSTYSTWTATDYVAFGGDFKHPDFQPTSRGRPYDGLMVTPDGNFSIFTKGGGKEQQIYTCRITANWGFSATVPADIKEATLMTAARWYKRYEGSMADALASGDFGKLVFTKGMDPFVATILIEGRYWRPPILAE